MTTVEKIGLAIVGVAMATTLVLPGRQTPAVLTRLFGGFSGALQAATGQRVSTVVAR
jgi:hypothetical protein